MDPNSSFREHLVWKRIKQSLFKFNQILSEKNDKIFSNFSNIPYSIVVPVPVNYSFFCIYFFTSLLLIIRKLLTHLLRNFENLMPL